jgi:metallophosphoesterase superfamily enzyme
MPAFGKYTGGLDIKDTAFTDLFDLKKADVHLTYNGKIYLL